MRIKNEYIFITLCLLFLIYTASIYLQPALSSSKIPVADAVAEGEGKLVWQKYNCQSCHQIYGLGGYLGPDLTNVLSAKGKGRAYIIGMLSSGTKQMPVFNLSAKEQEALLAFLKGVNESGNADPRNFETNAAGMIRKK